MHKKKVLVLSCLTLIVVVISSVLISGFNKPAKEKNTSVLSAKADMKVVTPTITLTPTAPAKKNNSSPSATPTASPTQDSGSSSTGNTQTPSSNNETSQPSQNDASSTIPTLTPMPSPQLTPTPSQVQPAVQASVPQAVPACYIKESGGGIVISGDTSSNSIDKSQCVPWADRFNYPPYNGQGTGAGTSSGNTVTVH